VSCALGPGRSLKVVRGGNNRDEVIGNAIDQQTSVRPDCGGFQTGTRIYFSRDTMRAGGRSRRIQETISRRKFNRLRAGSSWLSRCDASDAGRRAGGVVGVCGPRTGNSSGVWPGNSSGRCGSPGSCTGGGISGAGFPGGFSGGGSVGRPGWIGGSSVGSIGITSPLSSTVADGLTAPAKRCSLGRLSAIAI